MTRARGSRSSPIQSQQVKNRGQFFLMLGGQTVRDVSPQREKHKRPIGSGIINRLHRIMITNWTKQIVLCPPHQSSHKDCLFSQTTHESVFASVQAHPPCLCKCARVLTASAWCWWSRISDQWYFENDIWFLHWRWPYHPWQWNNNHSLPSNTADLVWSWVVQFNPQSWGFYKIIFICGDLVGNVPDMSYSLDLGMDRTFSGTRSTTGLLSPMSWACPCFWVMSGTWPPTTILSSKICVTK